MGVRAYMLPPIPIIHLNDNHFIMLAYRVKKTTQKKGRIRTVV